MREDIIFELEKIYDTLEELRERILKLEEASKDDIVNTIRRVEDIEEYLTIRSRGYFRRFIGK